jgi:hypothetical protein
MSDVRELSEAERVKVAVFGFDRPESEFDGDVTGDELAAWGRYSEIEPNVGTEHYSIEQVEQDAFCAGYRAALRTLQPGTVTTVEELDALPNDTVIRDCMGDVGVVFGGHVWYPETSPVSRSKVGKNYLPATVLFSPPSTEEGK